MIYMLMNYLEKKGVAKSLLQKAKNFALENRAMTLTLSTQKDNFFAQKLYELLQYKKDDEFLNYYLLLPLKS